MVLKINRCLGRRVGAVLLCALAVGTLALATSVAGASRAGAAPSALAASVLSASDKANLHYIESRSSGSRLFEEGSASGTLPGSMRVNCDIGPSLSGNFTIFTHGGSIVGHGTAAIHGSGVYESFAGSLVVTGGTGRYAHAHGRAGLYGVFNHRTYALTVQTTGRLSY
jgi:hypothetical protein